MRITLFVQIERKDQYGQSLAQPIALQVRRRSHPRDPKLEWGNTLYRVQNVVESAYPLEEMFEKWRKPILNRAASASWSRLACLTSGRYRPRLCKNSRDGLLGQKLIRKSRFYVNSWSVDPPHFFRNYAAARASIFDRRFYTLWARNGRLGGLAFEGWRCLRNRGNSMLEIENALQCSN